MKRKKKLSKTLLNIVLVIILVTLILFMGLWFLYYMGDDDSFLIENFKVYREDFENMKSRILELSNQHEYEEISLWINYNVGSQYFNIDDIQIELSPEEEEWVENIIYACGSDLINRIKFDDDRIMFGMEGNHYAFVYSVDGSTPQYMSVPDEYWKWVRKKLGENWYFFSSR